MQTAHSPGNYIPIRVSTLRGDRKITFNAYVRVAEKYILYCRSGDSFEGERLDRLKAKKLQKLYILQADEQPYRQYLDTNIEEAFDLQKEKDLVTRTQIIQGHQQAVAEDIMEHPDSKTHYDLGKYSSEKFIDYLVNEKLSLKVLLNIKNDDFSVSQHGVNVAALSYHIARKLGVAADSAQMNLLALGSLVHDFGHRESVVDLSKSREKMNSSEIKLYQQHPTAGIHSIRELRHFDNTVINIIHEHEEFIDGSGFPQKLQQKSLDPMSVVVSLANTFDRLISLEKMAYPDALKHLLIHRMGQHPLEMMKFIQEILKQNDIIK